MAGERRATFGAGCFWGVEADFRRVPGVVDTAVGYADGIEVVDVTFDPDAVSFADLLAVFWSIHDPTRLPTYYGGKYRSVVFVHDDEQRRLAEASLDEVDRSARYRVPVTTEVRPAVEFVRAPERDQRYLEQRLPFGSWEGS